MGINIYTRHCQRERSFGSNGLRPDGYADWYVSTECATFELPYCSEDMRDKLFRLISMASAAEVAKKKFTIDHADRKRTICSSNLAP